MTKQFYIIGHRGAPALAPENTIPSFARAIAEKVDGIELDVHYVDHQLVVIHDETVDRTSNGKGKLHELSFDELRQLDFGDGATIPTLVEVIEATPNSILINVELKGQDTGRPVAQLLHNYPTHEFMVSSFDRRELAHITEELSTHPNTEVALLGVRLTSRLMEEARQLNIRTLNVSNKFLKRKKLSLALQCGFRINVYTVNYATRARQLRNIGVSGVFTDDPAKLRALHDD
ncbi:MAG: glycerophosphoryl diester phosphodiesterase [Gammaproteobacteria bacterium]|nr:glycerophosphodiester phosphodiesterase family protein [Gammaproteobacteria bacterium]MXW07321.1 glycerophosphoryl diester phosphodiesterase [Gammaproteobacteria bacterium]MYC26264.1 glycerophosphoryl diester phosphodiesterase [Gammaproteobacteria bacterium]